MYSTSSGFSPIVHKALLLKILTTTNAMPYTASKSHAHAVGPPQGLTYLPLGHTPSILLNTNNIGDAHNALGFLLPYILHCSLIILDLVLGIGHVVF